MLSILLVVVLLWIGVSVAVASVLGRRLRTMGDYPVVGRPDRREGFDTG